MKIFNCPSCDAELYFENTECLSCSKKVGYDFTSSEFVMVDDQGADIGNGDFEGFVYCKNYGAISCNWVILKSSGKFCHSCQLTRTIPSSEDKLNTGNWKRLETAKRRLLYQLDRLGLPILYDDFGIRTSLTFDFLTKNNPKKAMTGHSNGTITILLHEADSVEREQIRKQMSEPYRTLIGHFRHEIGHYYWNYFFADSKKVDAFKEVFGNVNHDYAEALQSYYRNGPIKNWELDYISPYASSHPHEDWAETWAHYLHLMDTLETASHLGLGFSGTGSGPGLQVCPDPYDESDFDTLLDFGLELTRIGNSLNRSMGLPDIYPFVIPETVGHKLGFIHRFLPRDNRV